MPTNSLGSGITLSRIKHFKSIGRTGTGSGETVKHGLGLTPTSILVQLRDTIGAANQFTITSWNSTDIVLTVTNTAVYDLYALVDE